jgi:tRNA modification GTPase
VPIAYENDTISAVATPEGEGGISVIRVSGETAFNIVGRGFRGATTIDKMSSHTAHYGRYVDELEKTIDNVVILVLKNPNSFTGEDTVEISCHGGRYLTKKILESTIRFGARTAQPGEFTKRAFLNGKIDLAQAEAVADLIHARTERAHQASLAQLDGVLSKEIKRIREILVDSVSLLELELDFAEDGYEFADKAKVKSQLVAAISKTNELLSTYRAGRIFRDGVKVVLAGAPNVGKSSLLNALLQEERAIVTEIPGTTRDVIEESIRLGGIVFDISDTAGLRETSDLIEQEGVRRAEERLSRCDILLLMLDSTRPASNHELEAIDRLRKSVELRGASCVLVANKVDAIDSNSENTIDAERIVGDIKAIKISAKTHHGLDLLKESLVAEALHGASVQSESGVTITSARHFSALERASRSLPIALQTNESGISGEFVAVDIRAGLDALGEIVGATTSEDILNSIFSRFCIGK